MATRLRRRERVVHQRSPDAELAAGVTYRQRAEHERRDAPSADVPQPHGPDQACGVSEIPHTLAASTFWGISERIATRKPCICCCPDRIRSSLPVLRQALRTSNSGQQPLAHRGKGKACGGRTSVAQALAGTRLAVCAKG